MVRFRKGDTVVHAKFGLGMVAEAESEATVTVDFDKAGRKRLDLAYAPLRLATPLDEDAARPGGVAYEKWLETFAFENEEIKHYPGSHWNPFYDDSSSIAKLIPDILPKSLDQVSYADNYPAPRSCPPDWPKATYWVWPLRVHGLASVVRVQTGKPNELVSIFPFWAEGSQQGIVIDKVHIWTSGVEAQIECGLGDARVTFFDTLYTRNRDWHQAGKRYQFILTGIAYDCHKTEDRVIEITKPEVVEAMRKTELVSGDRIPIHTKGMAVFLPIEEWDRDDYHFRGPVKAVNEIEMLDQPSWKVRATVLRQLSDDSEFDLDIIVTRKVWGDGPPPQVGDDAEGALWLQGYLWYPEEKMAGR